MSGNHMLPDVTASAGVKVASELRQESVLSILGGGGGGNSNTFFLVSNMIISFRKDPKILPWRLHPACRRSLGIEMQQT